MIHSTPRTRVVSPSALLGFVMIASGVTGCGDPLSVDDPTAILEAEVASAQGAELLRREALLELFQSAGNAAWHSGVLADEFLYQQPQFWDDAGLTNGDQLLDRREPFDDQREIPNLDVYTVYSNWQGLRGNSAALAIKQLKDHAPVDIKGARVGEMFAVRAYAAMRLAEDFCPGFPLHEAVNFKLIVGPQASTQQALEYALANYDSSLTWASDDARVENFARIGKARTLLQLGRFTEAAATAAIVPTDYTYNAEFSTNSPQNPLTGVWPWAEERSVADQEGGNGLDFVSANDPRVETIQTGSARNGKLFYVIGKYPSPGTSITLASGLEARLIEAEAALNASDPQWLTVLNNLRATQISPALPALSDPGTAGREDLLFRERAFWLFATGTRLGDLRRLMRVYGRSSESVFPTGGYWRGGTYGTATSLPIARDERNFGASCTSQ